MINEESYQRKICLKLAHAKLFKKSVLDLRYQYHLEIVKILKLTALA